MATFAANSIETRRSSYAPLGIAGGADAEPVMVTPGTTGPEFGCAGIRDRVFAAHCEFSWRSENVSTPAGDGRRNLVFKRFKQTVSFDRAALLDRSLRIGDRIARSWDGATFQITAIYAQGGTLLCDVVEIQTQLQ